MGQGLAKVRIYHVKINSFEIRYNIGKIKRRETRKSYEEAIERAKEIQSQLENFQEPLPPKDLQTFQFLNEEAKKAGKSLMEIYEEWCELSKGSPGETLLKEVVREFISDQISRDVSAITVKTNQSRLASLVKYFQSGKIPIGEIKASQIDGWLLTSFENLTTRKNHRTTATQLWKWATKKGMLQDKQFTEADKTTIPIIAAKDPEVYMPEDFEKVFHSANYEILPHLALAAFSGIRNAELQRLVWEDIILEDGEVYLSASVTKTGRRRIASIAPQATNFLREWVNRYKPRPKAKVSVGASFSRQVNKSFQKASIKPIRNGLRKSYISYAVASGEKSAHKIAEECGHSEAVLQSTYKGLVTKNKSAEWFAIPQSL